MELELGLKITHTRDDITSHANLRIAKDHSGPLFLSRETETMFILIAYLKGFRRENIDIKINEDGNRIAISGKRAVQEMVLSGWIMHKKDVELRAFHKVFQIPDGIILDRIKAKFGDEESSLTIIMPKSEKGMRGVEIEEVKEEKEIEKENPQVSQTVPDKPPAKIKKMEEIEPVLQKDTERRELEIPQVPKDRKEESDQIVDQRQIPATEEVAEVFPERDNSKGMPQEKTEEPKIENKDESERVAEVKKIQDLAEEARPERPANMELEKEPEIASRKESEEAPSEKTEPPTTTTHPEVATMEPEEVKPEKKNEQLEKKEIAPITETQSEELPDLKEQEKKQEIPEAKIVEEEKIEEHVREQESTELTELPKLPTQSEQESKKQDPDRNVQEQNKPEPDQEKNQAETMQPGIGNEIKEDAKDQVKVPEEKQVEEHEFPEVKKQNKVSEGETKPEKAVSKGSKLRQPLVVAGSAILVSLIVLVINFIRSKRR